jgi:predicted Zn-dependent protease
MEPLIAKMNKPIPRNDVKITVLDDENINAANGGGGDFYVTTGLMAKANDEQLRGIMAHEVAHADLGHVASTQKLATGLQLGMILLDQIYPGASSLTPIAGQLIVNAYTRGEEHEADAHGVELLKRNGQNGKAIMANTLSWLEKTSGGGGGGFFSTHPATGDRVEAVQKLP